MNVGVLFVVEIGFGVMVSAGNEGDGDPGVGKPDACLELQAVIAQSKIIKNVLCLINAFINHYTTGSCTWFTRALGGGPPLIAVQRVFLAQGQGSSSNDHSCIM